VPYTPSLRQLKIFWGADLAEAERAGKEVRGRTAPSSAVPCLRTGSSFIDTVLPLQAGCSYKSGTAQARDLPLFLPASCRLRTCALAQADAPRPLALPPRCCFAFDSTCAMCMAPLLLDTSCSCQPCVQTNSAWVQNPKSTAIFARYRSCASDWRRAACPRPSPSRPPA
jgi:hypothetical protein